MDAASRTRSGRSNLLTVGSSPFAVDRVQLVLRVGVAHVGVVAEGEELADPLPEVEARGGVVAARRGGGEVRQEEEEEEGKEEGGDAAVAREGMGTCTWRRHGRAGGGVNGRASGAAWRTALESFTHATTYGSLLCRLDGNRIRAACTSASRGTGSTGEHGAEALEHRALSSFRLDDGLLTAACHRKYDATPAALGCPGL